jgi:hypothetical protein
MGVEGAMILGGVATETEHQRLRHGRTAQQVGPGCFGRLLFAAIPDDIMTTETGEHSTFKRKIRRYSPSRRDVRGKIHGMRLAHSPPPVMARAT